MIARRAAGVLLFAASACGEPRPSTIGAQVGPALAAALAFADELRAPWRCAAPDGPQHPEDTLAVDGHTWKLSGHGMRREGAARGPFVIGAIADAAGAAAPTMAALGRLRTGLAGADLVLALGGMGASQAELEATLGAIAERAPYPVIALPGDLESVPALTTAIATLRERGMPVVDGRLLHAIEVPGGTIALVPGAAARARLSAGDDGCVYGARDAASAYAALTGRDGIRIAATTEPPRLGHGSDASGELALTPGAGHEIDVVLHAPAGEAASRAQRGGRDAGGIAISPGTADATLRLPGPLRPSTAGLVTISGAAWSWKPLADHD